MARMTKEQWQALDWSLPNRVLAAQTGQKSAWVACMRSKLGVGPATKKAATNVQPSSVKALKDHARPESHREMVEATIKRWRLKTPDGRWIEGRNLRQLVRDHANEFDPDDVVWSGGRGGGTCQAVGGLYQASRSGGFWKGWEILNLDA